MQYGEMIGVSASGLRAQSLRMRLAAENIANADSLGQGPGAAPYQRRMAQFAASGTGGPGGPRGVKVAAIVADQSAFPRDYDPGNPAADAAGYVRRPNVSIVLEQADLKEAQRSYSANIAAIEAARAMATRTVDLLR